MTFDLCRFFRISELKTNSLPLHRPFSFKAKIILIYISTTLRNNQTGTYNYIYSFHLYVTYLAHRHELKSEIKLEGLLHSFRVHEYSTIWFRIFISCAPLKKKRYGRKLKTKLHFSFTLTSRLDIQTRHYFLSSFSFHLSYF